MKISAMAFSAMLACFSSVATADILMLPTGGYGITQASGGVQRGASKIEVLQQLGEPQKRHQAVGVPAISSWEYADFRVYFEDGLVLHTVFRAP